MSYYTYPHLRALILLAGLEIVEEFGSFARAPLDNQATEMIFVLQKERMNEERLNIGGVPEYVQSNQTPSRIFSKI
jgi:hypothetical protein